MASFGRPEDGLLRHRPWYRWGPTSRAGVGHGPRGLQRRRRRVGLLPARPRALARLPVERGRPGRLCDRDQRLCLALALWNGDDPILKERMFGLTGPEGNHGEDAKEYWWYLDAMPSHSWLRWRYHYPQRAFPYDDLVGRERRRGRDSRSTSCWTPAPSSGTGTGWSSDLCQGRAGRPADDRRGDQRRAGAGDAACAAHLWFRNTWSWGGSDGRCRRSTARRRAAWPGTSGSGLPMAARRRRRGARGVVL